MNLKSIALMFSSFLIFSQVDVIAQSYEQEITLGTYGAYADPSWYTELTLNKDSTFLYYDRVELGSSPKYEGKWKIEKNRLILFDCENNSTIPMPTAWRIIEKEICGKSKSKLKGKRTICLTLNEK